MQQLIDQVGCVMKSVKCVKHATKLRKEGKHERIGKMLKKLVKEQPAPVVDLLAVFEGSK